MYTLTQVRQSILYASFFCQHFSITDSKIEELLTINRLSIYPLLEELQNFMPYLYRTQVKQSPIHGRGLFALEDIPKGAVYWVYQVEGQPLPVKGFDSIPNRIYTQQQLQAIQDDQKWRETMYRGVYYPEGDIFVEFRDGSQFTNHSQNWNSEAICQKDYRKMRCVTTKQVKAGDEMTEYYGNYLSTQAKWVDDLMEKYAPERKDMERYIIQRQKTAVLQQAQK